MVRAPPVFRIAATAPLRIKQPMQLAALSTSVAAADVINGDK
jgi:hypothetical protein